MLNLEGKTRNDLIQLYSDVLTLQKEDLEDLHDDFTKKKDLIVANVKEKLKLIDANNEDKKKIILTEEKKKLDKMLNDFKQSVKKINMATMQNLENISTKIERMDINLDIMLSEI